MLTEFLWLEGKAFCLISPLADEDDNKMLTLLFNQFTMQRSKYFAMAIYHVVVVLVQSSSHPRRGGTRALAFKKIAM